MTKKNIKSNLLNHSGAKVKLLTEYLKRYLNIISSDKFTEQINIYDLFCGPGIYDNGGEGSPILILKQVRETYNLIINKKISKLPKINCFFNDIDSEKIEILSKEISDRSLHEKSAGNILLSSNDYKKEIENLKIAFRTYRNEKAFIFIDPYGYRDIKSSQIRDLLDCNRKAEVLLWLPAQHMYRFSENGTPEALHVFIKELTHYEE